MPLFRSISLIALIFLTTYFSLATNSATNETSLFVKGDHCVAYSVHKRLMLLRNVTVVGKNCEPSTQIIPDVGGVYYVKVEIPIDKFSSGETERDRDVKKVLKEKVQPNIIFTSQKLTKEDWIKHLKAGKTFEIKGELDIGGKKYPITASAQLVKGELGLEIDGVIHTQFKHFSLEPPTLVGGLMAKVGQDLDLHFHLKADRTLGALSLIGN